jgi:hypothetical protein
MRGYPLWTDARRAKLAELYGEGLGDGEIARAIGTTKRAIAVQRGKQGLVCRRLATSGSIRDYTSASLLHELKRRGDLPGFPRLRRVTDYTTGTLLNALRSRGYSITVRKQCT